MSFLKNSNFLVPIVLFCVLSCNGQIKSKEPKIWKEVFSKSVVKKVENLPKKYRLFKLNSSLLKKKISAESKIPVPLPEGGFAEFEISDSKTMNPALAAKYPGLKTYKGKGTNTNSSLRMEMNDSRFNFMIFSDKGEIYINPINKTESMYYIEYYKSDIDSSLRMPFELANPIK